jgi:hypothetical protein
MVESCEVDTRIDFVFQGKTGSIFEVSLDTWKMMSYTSGDFKIFISCW